MIYGYTLKQKNHIEASNAFSTSRSISSYRKINLFKTAAVKWTISLFIAAHCSILSCDHLGELCKKYFKKSDAALYTRLHRFKCTAIISNVIGPYFARCLKETISDSFYSILIDEPTDISVLKFLGIIIVYFIKTLN